MLGNYIKQRILKIGQFLIQITFLTLMSQVCFSYELSKAQLTRQKKIQREEFCNKQILKWSHPFAEQSEVAVKDKAIILKESYKKKSEKLIGSRIESGITLNYKVFDCENPVVEMDFFFFEAKNESDSKMVQMVLQHLEKISLNESARIMIKNIIESLKEFDRFEKTSLNDGYLLLPTKPTVSCQFKRLSKKAIRLRYSQIN